MRTREDQVEYACQQIVQSNGWANLEGWMRGHILEAEARGAAEQRRKDGENQAPSAWTWQHDHGDIGWRREFSIKEPRGGLDFVRGITPLYAHPANVAALEAEIAALKEAEQLARADAEASKARVEMLEGQITALNTPQYYAVEGDDFAQNSIADIFDDCDAERNTIIQVNGYRQVSSEWVFFDGESLHVFPTENEAEAAHTALTREGGV